MMDDTESPTIKLRGLDVWFPVSFGYSPGSRPDGSDPGNGENNTGRFAIEG